MFHTFEVVIDIPVQDATPYIDYLKSILAHQIERFGKIGHIKSILYFKNDKQFERGCEALEREFWEHGEIEL
jgi:hypothetical protein